MGFCIVNGMDFENKDKYCNVKGWYYKISDQNAPAPIYWEVNEENIVIAVGDTFNISLEELVNKKWELNSCVLEDILGEYSIIKINFDSNRVYFASSKAGIENLYYYQKDEIFLITDNFWEAIKVIVPNKNDIDEQALWESVIFPYPVFDSTIIKDLKWLQPATKGDWSLESKKLTLNKYWHFRYNVDKSITLDNAVEKIDQIIDNSMKLIKEKCGDVKYAVGLSGGLDSRIIPYYALKNKMDLRAFIIAERNPKTPLISRDYQSARKLAKYFDIELHEISPTSDLITTQYENDIETYPLGPAAIGKLVFSELPEFDVLLTGGSGLIMGSELPKFINDLDTSELYGAIYNHSSKIKDVSLKSDRISRAIKYLFDVNIKFKSRDTKMMIPENILKNIEDKWVDFIEERKEKGYNNLEIYEDYFNNYLGYRNRLGAFESLGGTKRSFSIYIPFLFDESLKWDLNFLEDRKLLKEVVSQKISDVAHIKMQSYHVDIKSELSYKINKIITMGDFMLRGSGTGIISRKRDKKRLKKLIESILNNETTWFAEHINNDILNEIIKKNDYKQKYSYLISKRKSIVDIIERKDYQKFGL